MCNRESKPVITATQMLDSMIRNPRPTRAEVADVANAIYDGSDCVMLSGETAAGAHPVDAVRMMAPNRQESELRQFEEWFPERTRSHARASLAVGIAAVQTAETLDAACIVAPTMSGRTARLISNLRPRVPILAVTPFPRVMRQSQLSWGRRAHARRRARGYAASSTRHATPCAPPVWRRRAISRCSRRAIPIPLLLRTWEGTSALRRPTSCTSCSSGEVGRFRFELRVRRRAFSARGPCGGALPMALDASPGLGSRGARTVREAAWPALGSASRSMALRAMCAGCD